MVQIRNAQDRTDDVLLFAPGSRDVGDSFIPANKAIVQHSFNHEERNEHEQNERAHAKQFEHRAVPPAEERLRLREWWRCVRHWTRLKRYKCYPAKRDYKGDKSHRCKPFNSFNNLT